MELLSTVLMCGIFTTVEFYVIISVVAASVVALMALPDSRGEVKQYLLAGDLRECVGQSLLSDGPGTGRLIFEVHEANMVSLRREGLSGVAMNGAVSLAVEINGFDIRILERVTPGSHPSIGEASAAVFIIDFLAPERYHVYYESERYGEHAALTLHVRQGIVVSKDLIY